MASIVPKMHEAVNRAARISPFLQNWKPKMRGNGHLPSSITDMLKVSQKHKVDVDCSTLSKETLSEMPMWDHKGTKKGLRSRENKKWAKCQRNNHGIITVHQMQNYIARFMPPNHRQHRNCAYNSCKGIKATGCVNPTACQEEARKTMDSLTSD